MSEPAPDDDPRVHLAGDRTLMAEERTYAAWMRTGIAAMFAGVGAHAVDDRIWGPIVGRATGTVLMAFAAFCFFAAMWRQMRKGAAGTPADIHRMPSWLLWIANGSLIAVALAGMVGLLGLRF